MQRVQGKATIQSDPNDALGAMILISIQLHKSKSDAGYCAENL